MSPGCGSREGFALLLVDEVNSFGHLLELEHDWGSVLEKCGDNSPFLTWDWVSTYWKYFGKGKTLRTLVIKDSKCETVAIAPLRQSRYSFLGSFGYEVIEPLAFYWGLVNAGIMLPGWQNLERQGQCLRLFLRHLYMRRNWDFMYLFDLQKVSMLSGLLSRLNCGSEVDCTFETGAPICCTVLPASRDLLMKSLSARYRHHLRWYMRKLEKEHGKVEFKSYNELGSVEKTVKVFFDLRDPVWGKVDDKKTRDFYLELAIKLAKNGRLALSFLTANDEPVASMYCIEYNRRMYYLIGAYDPKFSHYSIGNLLASKVMENCIEKGILEFDFGKGQLSKIRYPVSVKRNWNIQFKNRKPLARLYSWGTKRAKQTRMDLVINRFLRIQ